MSNGPEPVFTDDEEREARHLTVLQGVIENEPVDNASLAEATGLTRRQVRSSYSTLEHRGLIEVTTRGAVTTDAVEGFLADLGEDLSTYVGKLERGEIEYGEESTSFLDRIRRLLGG